MIRKLRLQIELQQCDKKKIYKEDLGEKSQTI